MWVPKPLWQIHFLRLDERTKDDEPCNVQPRVETSRRDAVVICAPACTGALGTR